MYVIYFIYKFETFHLYSKFYIYKKKSLLFLC